MELNYEKTDRIYTEILRTLRKHDLTVAQSEQILSAMQLVIKETKVGHQMEGFAYED